MFNDQPRPHVINRAMAPEMARSRGAPQGMDISKLISQLQRFQAEQRARDGNQDQRNSRKIDFPGIYQQPINRDAVQNRDMHHLQQAPPHQDYYGTPYDSRGASQQYKIAFHRVQSDLRDQRNIDRNENGTRPRRNQAVGLEPQDEAQANGNWEQVQSNIKEGSKLESQTYTLRGAPLEKSSRIVQNAQLKVDEKQFGPLEADRRLPREEQIPSGMGNSLQQKSKLDRNNQRLQNRTAAQQTNVHNPDSHHYRQVNSRISEASGPARSNHTSRHSGQGSRHKQSQRNVQSPDEVELEKNSKRQIIQSQPRQQQMPMNRQLINQQIEQDRPEPKRLDYRNRVESRDHMKKTIQPRRSIPKQLPIDRRISSEPDMNKKITHRKDNQDNQEEHHHQNNNRGMFKKKQTNHIEQAVIESEEPDSPRPQLRHYASQRDIVNTFHPSQPAYQSYPSPNQHIDPIFDRRILDRAQRTRDQAPAANPSIRPRRIDPSPLRTSHASSSQRPQVTPPRRQVQLSRSDFIINDEITHIRQRLTEIQRQTHFQRTHRQPRTENDFPLQQENIRQRKMIRPLSINFIDNTTNAQNYNRRPSDNLRPIYAHEDSEQEEESFGVRRIEVPAQIQFLEVPEREDQKKELTAKAVEALEAFDIELERHEDIDIIKQEDCVQFYLPRRDLMIYWEYSGRFYLGQGRYLREQKRFVKQGKGTEIMFGEYVYKGNFRDNLKSGEGTANYDGGDMYEGDWKNDRFHGRGILITDGDRYEGDFSKGAKEGCGKQFMENGDVYVGEYKKGQFHGMGRYIWRNHNEYAGYFRRGYMDGIGEWNSSNGDSYKGQYSKNVKHGQGIYRWRNGRTYKGAFFNGELADRVSQQAKNTIPIERQISSHLIGEDGERSDYSWLTFGERRHSPDYILNNFYTGRSERGGLRRHIRNGQLE